MTVIIARIRRKARSNDFRSLLTGHYKKRDDVELSHTPEHHPNL
jgi:hypothetical protein